MAHAQVGKGKAKIAEEAFIYGFPMVMNYAVFHDYFIDKSSPSYKAPLNQLATPGGAAQGTPMEDARKLIADYVVGTDAERQEKAKTLFAALYTTLNSQRDQIMNGIERFSHKQKAMAEGIREEAQKLREAQDKAQERATADQAQSEQLANELAWQTRIFEDRRKSISYVCDVPVLIEKRLFDLGRAIQDALSADLSGK